MSLFAKRTALIYGYVGLVHLTVRTANSEEDGDLLGYARELHQQLEAEIEQQVRDTLGPDFEVLNVDFRKGSVEIWVALGAVGTFFMGFSRYESFVKSVNLLVSQLRGLVQRFFGQGPRPAMEPPIVVTGSWQPGPSVTAANQMLTYSGGIDSSDIVLAYLLLSHAALLGVFLWLLVRHLK